MDYNIIIIVQLGKTDVLMQGVEKKTTYNELKVIVKIQKKITRMLSMSLATFTSSAREHGR